jgi:transcriptional regulator with XRE-family HTH domain
MNTQKKTILQENIIRYLGEQDISPEYLDKKANLSPGTVRNILSGRSRDPRGETLTKLSLAINISMEALLGATIYHNGQEENSYDPDLDDHINKLVNEYIRENKLKISDEKARKHKKALYQYTKITKLEVDKAVVNWYLGLSL